MRKDIKVQVTNFFIRSYFVGMAVYIGVFMLNQSYIEVALIIGLMSHFITEPIIKYRQKSNTENHRPGVLKIMERIVIAFVIVSLIYALQLSLPTRLTFPLEPLSFSLIYQSIWQSISAVMKASKKLISYRLEGGNYVSEGEPMG